MKTPLGLLALMILCAACSAGRKFDTTHVHDIQKGAQSKQEIAAWFGPPSQTVSPLSSKSGSCVERWMWTYAHARLYGRTRGESLVVDFDKRGKVCDNAYSRVMR
jgi:hypothetical protein